eukprot:1156894-Pelagomonas_calceolata.AAC.8
MTLACPAGPVLSMLSSTHNVATMSTGPPCVVATVGTPWAAASISVKPKGSCRAQQQQQRGMRVSQQQHKRLGAA